MKYVIEIASGGMIHMAIFTTNGTGIQVIFRYYLNTFRDFSVGNTDGRDL
jgi:hypothetical protein